MTAWIRGQMRTEFSFENLKEKEYLKYLGVDRKKIKIMTRWLGLDSSGLG